MIRKGTLFRFASANTLPDCTPKNPNRCLSPVPFSQPEEKFQTTVRILSNQREAPDFEEVIVHYERGKPQPVFLRVTRLDGAEVPIHRVSEADLLEGYMNRRRSV